MSPMEATDDRANARDGDEILDYEPEEPEDTATIAAAAAIAAAAVSLCQTQKLLLLQLSLCQTPLLLCQKLLLLQLSPTSLRPETSAAAVAAADAAVAPLRPLCSLLQQPSLRRLLRLLLLPLLLFLVLSRTKLLSPFLPLRRHLPLPLPPLQPRTSSSSTKLPLSNASKRRPTPSPPPSPATPRATRSKNKWTPPKGSSTKCAPRLTLWPKPRGFASPLLLRPQPGRPPRRQSRRVSCVPHARQCTYERGQYHRGGEGSGPSRCCYDRPPSVFFGAAFLAIFCLDLNR
ncbi:unnamed protein product [Pylaiella littoralis]